MGQAIETPITIFNQDGSFHCNDTIVFFEDSGDLDPNNNHRATLLHMLFKQIFLLSLYLTEISYVSPSS